jgi:hypothetical protein
MGYASGKFQFGHLLRRVCKTGYWKGKCLILAVVFIAICAIAQQPELVWLGQIRLSGLSGSAGNRLAIINDKTFSAGEEADLKLNGKTVHVGCLEIREQSALIQIQGIPTPYELTYSCGIVAVRNNSVVAAPPQTAPPN